MRQQSGGFFERSDQASTVSGFELHNLGTVADATDEEKEDRPSRIQRSRLLAVSLDKKGNGLIQGRI
jgi:hypothetical protein